MNCDRIAPLFLKGLVLLLGIIIIMPTLYKAVNYTAMRLQSRLVYGTVSRIGQGQYLGSRPYVTFTGVNGKTYEVRSAVNYYFLFAPQLGDRVRVFYKESDPESALVDNWVHYILLPLVFLGVGFSLIYSVSTNTFAEKSA